MKSIGMMVTVDEDTTAERITVHAEFLADAEYASDASKDPDEPTAEVPLGSGMHTTRHDTVQPTRPTATAPGGE